MFTAIEKIDKGMETFKGSPSKETLQNLAKYGQNPEAIIVACADSRVAPEKIFNSEIGQFFTIRVAGNIIGANELASIEYAALALNVPLCIIIGHSSCGAVTASVEWHTEKKQPPTQSLEALVRVIEPAVEKVVNSKQANNISEIVHHATNENVRSMMRTITEQSPRLKEKSQSGEFIIKGCVLNMETISLEWID